MMWFDCDEGNVLLISLSQLALLKLMFSSCFISTVVMQWFPEFQNLPPKSCTYILIYVKNCSVYIQCKGDIVVVDIKQHKSQFKNSNFTITQSAKFF